MNPQGVDNLVMGTVNAPWKRTLAAGQLATMIKTADLESWLPHVATFFTEVKPHLLLSFAKLHGIPVPTLSTSYMKVKELTGESNKQLEQDLAGLGTAA
jgi:hypothetical protein